jgi:hypothetical protein
MTLILGAGPEAQEVPKTSAISDTARATKMVFFFIYRSCCAIDSFIAGITMLVVIIGSDCLENYTEIGFRSHRPTYYTRSMANIEIAPERTTPSEHSPGMRDFFEGFVNAERCLLSLENAGHDATAFFGKRLKEDPADGVQGLRLVSRRPLASWDGGLE